MKNVLRLTALLLFALFWLPDGTYAQTKEEKSVIKHARKYLGNGEYDRAKKEYAKLLELNDAVSEYWLEAGLAYYNSNVDRDKSIPYFERAKDFSGKKSNGEVFRTDTISEVFLYLGKAYQFVGRFSDAIVEYEIFRDYINDNKAGNQIVQDVDRFIEQCENGLRYKAEENKNLNIVNLGKQVNGKFPDYAPIINKDETIILFTSRRKGNVGKKFYNDNKKYEDIYVSVKQDEEWIRASKLDSSNKYISSKINSKYHDAAISYSHDEQKLFIYRRNDVWESNLINGKWSDPVRLSDNINTKGHEPSVFITPDGNSLFVVSDRKGGYGGRDIWKSEKNANGNWGEVTNLGPGINTAYDEDAPYITADGNTLFYSSNGDGTIGGYDIFKAELDSSGNFSESENMGIPINSPGDDIYYTQNEDKTLAFYASSKPFGNGDMDIYRIELKCPNIPNTEIRGIVVSEEDRQPIGGRIIVTDFETAEEVGTFKVDEKTGKYLLVLPPDRSYNLKVEVGAYLPHTGKITVPRQCDYFQMFQEIHVEYVTDSSYDFFAPQQALFRNAMFDVQSETEKYFGLGDLEQANNPNYNPEDFIDLVSVMQHNDKQNASGVYVYLLNTKNEIVRKIRTDESGLIKFANVNKNERYKILIDESSLKQSYYGDAASANPVNAKGILTYNKMGGAPARYFPIFIVDKDMKVIAGAKTNEVGAWAISSVDNTDPAIVEMNNHAPFKTNYQTGDLDQLYASFIHTIDTSTTTLNYSEQLDYIDIEMIDEIVIEEPERIEEIKEVMEEMKNDYIIPTFENILFDYDRSSLRKESKVVLDSILAFMKLHPEVTLNISGHTDWKGSPEYNMALSKRRTKAAYDYLVRRGISGKRLKQFHFGETFPAASNANPDGSDNPDGRQLNRRVEFEVLKPSEDEAPSDVIGLNFSFQNLP